MMGMDAGGYVLKAVGSVKVQAQPSCAGFGIGNSQHATQLALSAYQVIMWLNCTCSLSVGKSSGC